MCSKLSPPGIYLLRWGGLGKGVVGWCVRAQPGYVMAGRERDRQEPVLMPIPASATSEATLSLRAARLCWMFRVKFRNTTAPPTLLSPRHLIFGCQDKTALYAAVRHEYSAEIQSLISASDWTWAVSAETLRCSCSRQVCVKVDVRPWGCNVCCVHWVPHNCLHVIKLCGLFDFFFLPVCTFVIQQPRKKQLAHIK